MDNEFILILSLFYILLSCIYFFIEIKYIKRRNKITILSVSRFMYMFVYGALPALLLLREYYGLDKIGHIDLTKIGIVNLYLVLIFSIVGYFTLNLGFYIFPKKTKRFRLNKDNTIYEERKNRYIFFMCGFILLIVGWVSLFLWTKAYGLHTFIVNANRIRSGYGTIKNSLAFFKEFSKVIQIALYIFLVLFLQEKAKRKQRFIFFFLLLSIIGSIIFFAASDSRIKVGLYLVGVILLVLNYKVSIKQKRVKKYIFILTIFIILAYLSIIYSEYILNSFRFGFSISHKVDIFSSIENEFSYILQSQQLALKQLFEGTIVYKLFDDILYALFAWVPSRFIFVTMPKTLWQYNTMVLGYGSGILPTDILTAGIYYVGVTGVVVLPFFYGIILGFIEDKLGTYNYNWKSDILYYTISANFIQNISHFSYKSIILKMFPVLLYGIVFYICKLIVVQLMNKKRKFNCIISK